MKFIIYLALLIVFLPLSVWLTMTCWNHAVVHVFGLPTIDWTHSLAFTWLMLGLAMPFRKK